MDEDPKLRLDYHDSHAKRHATTMTDNIPDETPSSVPPSLSSSIILSALPRDATAALTQASLPSKAKGLRQST
jgi:hypothetical protein